MAQTTLEEDFADGTPARTARRATLEASRYTDPAVMVPEWQQIWTRCWLFAGLASDIPDAGDFFVFDLGRESIVVLRDDSGTVRAFYNVCQHRGNRIFASRAGSVARIACPYHGWSYALDGVLQEVPDGQRFSPVVDHSERSMKPVRVAEWAGMVRLSMDPGGPSLEQYLGPIMDRLAPFRFENMLLAKHQTVLLDANWKTARDNFLEQYHVDFIHPQHASLVDCCNATNILWPHGHSAAMVRGYVTDSRYPVPEKTPDHLVPLLQGVGLSPGDFDGRVAEIRQVMQQRKRQVGILLGFDYSGLSDEQVTDVWQYDIFPNTFMTIQAEELWIYGPRPHPSDPDKCFFDKWTLQIPLEVGADPDRGLSLNPRLQASQQDERPPHEVFTAQDVIEGRHSLTVTLDQDIHYLADMQAGMHSRGFDSAVLNRDEERVQHFHDWVDHYLKVGD